MIRPMKRWLSYGLAGSLGLAFLGGCVDRQAQQNAKATEKLVSNPVKVVSVLLPVVKDVDQTVEITGDLTTANDVTVGAKNPGRIVSVFVKDGDTVTAGQVLATQETTQLQAQLTQANAQLSQAQAAYQAALSQLAQAKKNAAVNPTKSSAGVAAAQAQLRSARAQLTKAKNGARPQERLQAQAAVSSAKSNMETQRKELDRIRTLVEQGAVAANRLDQQQAAYDAARSQYENAQQALNLIQEGTRQEDIDAAAAAVRQAEENLRTARSNKDLDSIYNDQVAAAQAQVNSARAQVSSAQSSITIAQQALADAQIKAPFSGKIYGKPVQPGAMLGAGATVARIVGGTGIYFDGQISSDRVDLIKPGMAVTVTVDGYGDRSFAGKVAAVSSTGGSVGRLFSVRVTIDHVPGDLRSGMFARGLVVTRTTPNAMLVPVEAVLVKGDRKIVYVANGSQASEVAVQTGLQQKGMIQVTGISPDSKVIVKGQDALVDKSQITVEGGTSSEAAPSDASDKSKA